MKKFLCVLLASVMVLTFCACGDIKNDSSSDTKKTSSKTTRTTSTTPTTKYDDGTRWIGNRKVQYNEADEEYVLFFSLSKEQDSDEYIAESGRVHIMIQDESDYTIYDKEIAFDATDFTSWNNSSWDGSRYMCGLYIPRSDIDGSSSASGTLTMTVTLADGSSFNPYNLTISNLPSLTVNIELPSVPVSYTDDEYSYSQLVEVLSLEYDSRTNYDGTASVTLKAKLKLVSKTDNGNESSYVHVGYKLYDEEGLVVASGQFLSTPIAIGEMTIADEYISNLNPRGKYKLTLTNAA